MIGFPGAPHGPGSCVLCGRDLWEASRIVRGESASICDACVTDADQVLKAESTARTVDLPPRVFGAELAEPDAATAIAAAFSGTFGELKIGAMELDPPIEDAEEIQPYTRQAAERAHGMTIQGAHVGRIRFLDSDRAEVRFTILLPHGPMMHQGLAVRRDGRWLVSRQTMTEVVAQSGIIIPPRSSP